MTNYYDRNGQPMELLTWAKAFEQSDRLVAKDTVGNAEISTVWIGIDHRFSDDEGRPLIFESMVFGGPLDQEQARYSTEDAAKAGHAALVAQVRETVVS